MRWGAETALAVLLITTTASAETMKAVRKGLLCEQADALARLTLPNGSSRTDTPNANGKYVALKEAGKCIDIPDGVMVTIQSRRKNTSIVTLRTDGVDKTYFTPNIDYTEALSTPQVPTTETSPQTAVAQDNSVGAQGATPPDVTGIRLGMTLKQAQSIIGPDYKYSDGGSDNTLVGPDVEMLLASKNPPPSQQSGTVGTLDDYVLLALNDKLFFIEHGQTFADADMPNTQTLRTALTKKYGKPSMQGTVGGAGATDLGTFWLYSSNNTLLPPVVDQSIVSHVSACRFPTGISVEQGDAGLVAPRVTDFRGPAGVCVYSYIQTAQSAFTSNPLFVGRFTIYLSDQGPMLQHLGQLQQEHDAKTKDAVEAAKAKVPKL